MQIVTVLNEQYEPLFHEWYRSVRANTDSEIAVIMCPTSSLPLPSDCCLIHPNPTVFPLGSPEEAAAYKMLVFEMLTKHSETVLFLDVDTIVLRPLTDIHRWEHEAMQGHFVCCIDRFVGYKERLAEEMRAIDPTFACAYFPSGEMRYVNTGVFACSKTHNADRFKSVLASWSQFANTTGHYPAILDQNILNYRLQLEEWPLCLLPKAFNCLRTDDFVASGGKLFIDGEEVVIFHLNGGSAETKIRRQAEFMHSHFR